MSKREIIVDDRDNPIGSKDWWNVGYDDIYRCSALWLTDVKTGDILLAQRKWTKKHDPGKWGTAAAGTIEVGETYETNMIKEIEEEIGLTNLELSLGMKQYVDDGSYRFFCQWFFAKVDKTKVTLRLEEKEVEAAEWVSQIELIKSVKDNPEKYISTMPETLLLFGLTTPDAI